MAVDLEEQAIIRETLRRKRAQESLHSYALTVPIPLNPNAPLDDLDEDLMGPARLLLPLHISVILGTLQNTMDRPFGRCMIFAPPGAAKSSYTSVVAPSWEMGRKPKSRIILTSYAADLAERQSRRAQMICRSPEFQNLWDNPLGLTRDAAGDWALSNESEMIAAGLLAGITGNRASGAIVDDPVAGRQEADSPATQKATLEAYQDDLLTRLMPNAWLAFIMCMTGDTPVLRADGTERPLRDVRQGDHIATWDEGRLVTSTVERWKNQGPDDVFEVELQSGIKVRANARHPFLTPSGTWKKLKNLSPGESLVRLAAIRPIIQPPGASAASSTATASRSRSTTLWSKLRAGAARLAANLRARTSALTGAASSASTTITQPGKCAGCCATTATSWSATARPRKSSKPERCTCAFVADRIVSITHAGREDVFDIQVAQTENFIANGVVSHNTRWNENDLAGQILPADYAGQSGMILCRDGLYWEVLNIPAKAEHADDPLGRAAGEYLWPEWFPTQHWKMFEGGESRAAQRTWSSLYQQRPTPQGNTSLDRTKIQWTDPRHYPPMSLLRIAGYSDFAVTEKASADWTEHAVFGIDAQGEVWLIPGSTWSGQVTSDKSIDELLKKAKLFSVRTWFDEKGVIHNSVGPALNKAMREKRIYLDVRSQSSNADKVSKIQGFIAIANTGIVHFPSRGPDKVWAEQALNQVDAMPAGRNDDKADVLGLLGRTIDQILNAPQAPPPRQEGIKPFTAEWLEWKDKSVQQVRYR